MYFLNIIQIIINILNYVYVDNNAYKCVLISFQSLIEFWTIHTQTKKVSKSILLILIVKYNKISIFFNYNCIVLQFL